MDIPRMMAADRVVMSLASRSKRDALGELAEVSTKSGAVADVAALKNAILEREEIMSTGIGLGIAIPHAKIQAVREFVLAVGLSRSGIDYDSLDGLPVKIIIMIAAPEGQQNTYLRILAKVTHVLREDATRAKILAAATPQEIVELFRE